MPTDLLSGSEEARRQILAGNPMFQRVRDLDWHRTPVGAVDRWPDELRSICRTVLLSSTPMAVLIGDDGVVFANNAIRLLFGPDYDHGLGKPVRDILLHNLPFADEILARARQGRSTRIQDMHAPFGIVGGKRDAWIDLDFTPIVDAVGAIIAVLVICVETTARKQALLDLEVSQERLDLALSAGSVIGVWELDCDQDVIRADARHAMLHGVDPKLAAEGLPLESFMAAIHPDDRQQVRIALDQVTIGEAFHAQHRVISGDVIRWVVASGRLRAGASGGPSRIVGTAVDVTNQVAAAAALADSEKRFRTYAETLPHLVFGWDALGQMIYANQRWYDFTGLAEGDARIWDWQNFLHSEDVEVVLSQWDWAVQNCGKFSFEARYLHHEAGYRWMRAAVSPIFDIEGDFTGWIGTLTDVHDEKMLEIEKDLVSKELDHRIRNFFALTQGLVGLTSYEDHDVASFSERLHGRLQALHQSHGLISRDQGGVEPDARTLHRLLQRILAPFTKYDRQDHILMTGDDVALNRREITNFALVFHELATNSVKYGALAGRDGQLHIISRATDDRLVVRWAENRIVSAPEKIAGSGFGSRLIDLLIERQMKGRFHRSDGAAGIEIEISVPRQPH